ncbi:hypothetical protein MICAG_2750013 [Microcystis aeruginosa PCC 9808]|uniref:Uncharacterized protein n=1 Tax=Microcystis aeruginosa PCC 9808 TaxID=1160284 RepID=I4HTB6_MICAE|nr:hypothetical protein MICAG_2750013 [Microcystis aeruginosa PCC 9808]
MVGPIYTGSTGCANTGVLELNIGNIPDKITDVVNKNFFIFPCVNLYVCLVTDKIMSIL